MKQCASNPSSCPQPQVEIFPEAFQLFAHLVKKGKSLSGEDDASVDANLAKMKTLLATAKEPSVGDVCNLVIDNFLNDNKELLKTVFKNRVADYMGNELLKEIKDVEGVSFDVSSLLEKLDKANKK